MVKTRLWYVFKAPNHRATKKQVNLVLDLFEKRHWKLNDRKKMEKNIIWLTVLQCSMLIEHLIW